MGSIILELQNESLSQEIKTSTLLKKAYVIARKLKIEEFETWIYKELNGYKCSPEEIPDYRVLSVNLKAYNPYNGWISVILNDPKIEKMFSTRKVADSISNLEALFESNGDTIAFPIAGSLRKQLASWTDFDTNYSLLTNKTQVKTILERTKNIVLEWSLKLEEDGIMGENMKFSEQERTTAKEQNYTVNNFYGNLNHSQLQQNSNGSIQQMHHEEMNFDKVRDLIKLINDNTESLNLDEANYDELNRQIKIVKENLEKEKPNNIVIRESLKSMRNILEGISGSIIATGLLYHFQLLGM